MNLNPVTHRPESLGELAEHADSIEAWGLALGDFLDEIAYRRRHGLPIASWLHAAPPLLREKFPQGELAAAFAAALATQLAADHLQEPPPAWTQARERFLGVPVVC